MGPPSLGHRRHVHFGREPGASPADGLCLLGGDRSARGKTGAEDLRIPLTTAAASASRHGPIAELRLQRGPPRRRPGPSDRPTPVHPAGAPPPPPGCPPPGASRAGGWTRTRSAGRSPPASGPHHHLPRSGRGSTLRPVVATGAAARDPGHRRPRCPSPGARATSASLIRPIRRPGPAHQRHRAPPRRRSARRRGGPPVRRWVGGRSRSRGGGAAVS
jgi:hypothetical protein